ncbi:MAG: glycerophosphodiester phosphodiesterase [Lysobacterales bacterium]|nr:MAG: glycerophosphodiester phosphodiesterase [Xanthomonadales bacterium]
MTPQPIVIAHRGASGYLPEHTLAAKALAHGLGADFIEQDVVATRDSQLVVLHDLYLDDVSDVALRFPGRQRDDGRHYVVDFDLAELRTLTLFERRAPGTSTAKYPSRFPAETGLFGVATLADELRLVRGLNRSTGRSVGIYPEIKDPDWHRRHGIDLAKLLLTELRAFGYSSAEAPAFVQCFDAAELARLKHELGCPLRLIQLVAPEHDYGALLTAKGLRSVSTYAYGLGPHYSQLVEHQAAGRRPRRSDLGPGARGAGLALHAYTFRRDDLPAYAQTLEELLGFFWIEVGVDGVFCDHPDVAVRVRDEARKVQ